MSIEVWLLKLSGSVVLKSSLVGTSTRESRFSIATMFEVCSGFRSELSIRSGLGAPGKMVPVASA